MGIPKFENLETSSGLKVLDVHLSTHMYISGHMQTTDDINICAKVPRTVEATKFPHVHRWAHHIASFLEHEKKLWTKGSIKEEDDDDFDLFGAEETGGDAAEKTPKIKKEKTKEKKKVIARSSLVIEVKPGSTDTDLDHVGELVKAISIEGLKWGESIKRVPVAFGLFKIQLSCVVIDELTATDDIIDAIETLEMTEEQKLLRRKRLDGLDQEGDEEVESLVQSCEVVSFNKI